MEAGHKAQPSMFLRPDPIMPSVLQVSLVPEPSEDWAILPPFPSEKSPVLQHTSSRVPTTKPTKLRAKERTVNLDVSGRLPVSP